MKKLIMMFSLTMFSLSVNALTCFVDDSEGNRWYKNLPSKNGTFPKTLGTTTSAKVCPAIGLRVEESKDKAACMRNALLVCDPTWGGSKLNVNPLIPDSKNQCLFYKIKSSQATDSNAHYSTIEVYDATKINTDTLEVSCPQ